MSAFVVFTLTGRDLLVSAENPRGAAMKAAAAITGRRVQRRDFRWLKRGRVAEVGGLELRPVKEVQS